MKKFLLITLTLLAGVCATAQDNGSSTSSAVMRRSASDRKAGQASATPGVSQRMQSHFESEPMTDSELQWMRVMYRSLDLTKDANGALYYPDEPVEGQDNLFRIIMKNMADGHLKAYEYLDGREMFTPDFQVKLSDVLDRFYILYTPAKGSTEKNPRYVIEEADIPAAEVLSYYIIEKWEFDRRSNRMRTRVEAICPVLHRAGDFGAEAVRYPMFWVKYDDLRPYITTQNIFTDDDNNLATCTYDDYFQLGLYDGEIYKTRNLKNKSLMQLYPDADDLAHARDSIQQRLDNYEKKLWVPSLEELAARREAADKAKELAEASDEAQAEEKAPSVRSSRSKRGSSAASRTSKPAQVKKNKKPKALKSTPAQSSATRSVRNRRR
ncbi:MAG: gliding motility protein GldN [Duncaniella sp.]|nr:gliding motility protein GldN [Duncaniella sp.]